MTNSNLLRPYLVAPKLIEQPTWGGRYILQMKRWSGKKIFKDLLIGQSYELYSGTVLRNDIVSTRDASFTGQLGYAMKPDKIFYKGDKKKLLSLQKLIDADPVAVLGKRGVKQFGNKMQVLIKFTQAKGNSFQLHVREKDQSKKWIFKPESWYYFEPGILTLGIKKTQSITGYKEACQKIDRRMEIIAKRIQAKEITLEEGKKLAKSMIRKIDPWQYVNLVKVKKDEILDLSSGGLHHSWEEDPDLPLGNVVYELCFDVMDPISVLRSFDKGKIKSDGSLRKLTIAEYFRYLDKSSKTNTPETHLSKGKLLTAKQGVKQYQLMRSKYYCLDKIVLADKEKLKLSTDNSFQHFFVKSGTIEVKARGNKLLVGTGHSCFIPEGVKSLMVSNLAKKKAVILKTFI